MTDQDKVNRQVVLENAIQKAILSKWDVLLADTDFSYGANFQTGVVSTGLVNPKTAHRYIFNHDFAKALWGEELHQETFIVPKELNKRFAGTKDLDIKPTWMYHLQQMVVAEDPIEYLADNID